MNYFRYKHHLKIPYNIQGLIYFLCKNHKIISNKEHEQILRACHLVCKDNVYKFNAVHDVMTSNNSLTSISMKHFLSETSVIRLEHDFYREYAKDIETRLQTEKTP